MTLTVSEASRAYREKRKAKLERLARLEAALEKLSNPTWAEGTWQQVAADMQKIARDALAGTPPVFSGFNEDR